MYNYNIGYAALFDKPPHERRRAYFADRNASGFGSAPVQKDVLSLVYVSQNRREPIIDTVASVDFLDNMKNMRYSIQTSLGEFVNATGICEYQERLNNRAKALVGCGSPLHGMYYWRPKTSVTETWWRTSFPRDPAMIMRPSGKVEDNLRIDIYNQINRSETEVGPFFVEIVWGLRREGREPERFWADVYAPTTTALTAIACIL